MLRQTGRGLQVYHEDSDFRKRYPGRRRRVGWDSLSIDEAARLWIVARMDILGNRQEALLATCPTIKDAETLGLRVAHAFAWWRRLHAGRRG